MQRRDTPRRRRGTAVDAAARFGANVREERQRRGLSQEALAAAADLHRTEISLLERGAREPRLSTVVRLACALGVRVSTLLRGLD
jgi:transcriptional regulator with XRE-family HTH domain